MEHLLAIPAGRRAKWVVLGAWLVAAGVLALFAGRLHTVTTNDVGAFLPRDAESTLVADIVEQDFPSAPTTPVVLVYQNEDGLDDADVGAIVANLAVLVVRIADLQAVNLQAAFHELDAGRSAAGGSAGRAGALAKVVSKNDTTVVLEIPIDSIEIGVVEPVVERIQQVLGAGRPPPGLEAYVTGPAGLMVDGYQILGSLGATLLVASVALILVLLAAGFRSLLVPLAPLVTVGLAYAVAAGLVYLAVKAWGLAINSQTTSLLVIVMFGVGTDYCVYLVARYREELRSATDPHDAMRAALRRTTPAILSCGMTVTAAMLVLLVADLQSTRNQGPVLAFGVLVTMLAGLTLLPALLTIAGRHTFWPLGHGRAPRRPRYERIGGVVVRRPVIVAASCVIGLGGLAAGVATGLQPLSLNDGFRDPSGALEGVAALERAFPPGRVSPTRVIVEAPASELEGATRAVDLALAADPAVVATNGEGIDRAAGVSYLTAILDVDPYGNEAVALVPRLREEARAAAAAAGGSALVGGATAAEADTIDAYDRDARLIFPMTLAVVFVLLAVFLRSLVAPGYLVATAILSVATAYGISLLFFDLVVDAPGLMVGFSTFLFVFLVAFGVDYNIFLVARIREEAARVPTREAVRRGLVATGPVITTAGLVLGGTFAMLTLLPLWQLFQLGFGVAIGVLVDTLVVRTLLVPAITALLGDRAWWPGRISCEGGGRPAIIGGASGRRPAHIERG